MPPPYADQRKMAQRVLSVVMTHKETARIIHYASESFVGREGSSSARVTAIAVKNLDNGNVTAFSIKGKSEALAFAPTGDENLDQIERAMLGDFFEYLSGSGEVINYVHWNMRGLRTD